jgi:hypothetical protein
MLEETLGGRGGERGREGRERGGDAAVAEADEQGGEVACRVGGGRGGQRAGELGGYGIGDRRGEVAAAEEEEGKTGRWFHGGFGGSSGGGERLEKLRGDAMEGGDLARGRMNSLDWIGP